MKSSHNNVASIWFCKHLSSCNFVEQNGSEFLICKNQIHIYSSINICYHLMLCVKITEAEKTQEEQVKWGIT